MPWTYAHAFEVDPSRPIADLCSFNLKAADEPNTYIITQIADRHFQRMTDRVEVRVHFATETSAVVSFELPARFGSKFFTAWVIFLPVVWLAFMLLVAAPLAHANQVSIGPFILMAVIFLPFWFGMAIFSRNRYCRKLAVYLAYAAYHRLKAKPN